MIKFLISIIALIYCNCACYLNGRYDSRRMDGSAHYDMPTDSCCVFVESFERLGSISPAEQKAYEVKSSVQGPVTLEMAGIMDGSPVGTLYDPGCLVRFLRDADVPVAGIVAGKYKPLLDRSGKTPVNYVQAFDLKPEDLVLSVTMTLARKSPWWTWLQALDFMLHALVLPTIESNYYAVVQYRLLNRNKELLSLWAVNVQAKYRGPLTKLPGEEEIARLAFEQIESDFKNKIQALGCSCNKNP